MVSDRRPGPLLAGWNAGVSRTRGLSGQNPRTSDRTGEIEAALEERPDVHGAVAVAFGEGGQRLGAAVVGPVEDVGNLREHLAQLLPSYMVPERIIALEQMPLSANGKVDRKRIGELVASAEGSVAAAADAPRGEVEQRLAQLWSQLLGKAEITQQDNFFALGGDSLLATKLLVALVVGRS